MGSLGPSGSCGASADLSGVCELKRSMRLPKSEARALKEIEETKWPLMEGDYAYMISSR